MRITCSSHANRSMLSRAFSLLLFLLLLSACTDTRPVVKLGLLAPFEGLYRQDGYDALAAMRAAIVDQTIGTDIGENRDEIDVLPLALDSSRDVARAGQKAMADPSVVVIIGPYWAADGMTMGRLAAGDRWLHPYAPSGDEAWLAQVLDLVSAYTDEVGRTLLVAGVPAGWPEIEIPLVQRPEEVKADQSILWLGDVAAGAMFAQAVWEQLPDTPFGLYGSGMDVFRQRVQEQASGPLFLVGWIDDQYSAWAEDYTTNTPAVYTVYRQTADTLKRLAGEPVTTVWQPAIFLPDTDDALFFLPSE